MQELLIEKIRTDGDVQSRERISDDYVEELADLIQDGKKLPPIEVFNDGTDIWVSDGFHRIHAHLKANKRTIRCDVKKGTKAAAMLASCAANQTHGLRRTNADKRRAMELTLKLKPDWSDQAIANHAGVHVNTVALTRRQLPQNVGVERTGVDGKTRKIPPPPGTPKPTKDAKPQQDKPKKIPPPPSGQTGVGVGQGGTPSP
ncbi:MAG: ParB N-terminal domain-containing protein, partial [bacterium]